MSATSGIPIHDDLQHAFAAALDDLSIRFLILAIKDEHIVLEGTAPTLEGTLLDDLPQLQDILLDDTPAYVLARLDDSPSQWLAISYVPDTAKVRDKMLYASTRTSVTKSLGSASFPSTLFATSKSDLTPAAYSAHLAHQSAPLPLSDREKEMASVRAANVTSSSERRNHLAGAGVSINWPEDVREALERLGEDQGEDRLVVLRIDTKEERLWLASAEECTANDIATALPSDGPAFSFFSWSHGSRRDIIYIYSCPSGSPIKDRMIYSSSAASVLIGVKDLGLTLSRKLETSDPKEINEKYLRSELGVDDEGETVVQEEKKAFARPKGPARRQR